MKKILPYLIVAALTFAACGKKENVDPIIDPKPDPTYTHMNIPIKDKIEDYAVDRETNDFQALPSYFHEKTRFQGWTSNPKIDPSYTMDFLESTLTKESSSNLNGGTASYTMGYKLTFLNPPEVFEGKVRFPVTAVGDKGKIDSWKFGDLENIVK